MRDRSSRWRAAGFRLPRRTSVGAALTALVLAGGLVSASPAVSAQYRKHQLWSPGPLAATRPVSGRDWTAPATTPTRTAPAALVAAPVWPAAGAATVALATAAPVRTGARATGAQAGYRAGTLPVYLAKAAGSSAAPAAAHVSLLDHPSAQAAGVSMLFSVARTDGVSSGGSVHVAVDASDFAKAFGGGFEQRLHLVRMPACALTTPHDPSCRIQTPVSSTVDPATGLVSADVAVPAAPTAAAAAGISPRTRVASLDAGTASANTASVMALTTGPSGAGGSYAATSLKASDAWSAGGETGGFTYDYPVQMPPSLGGSTPSVSLGYSSQASDGMTSVGNPQSSWIGEGWSYSPGFIERSYKPCSQDGQPTSADMCYSNSTLSMSVDGHSGPLVHNDADGTWRLQDDDGTKVEELFNVPFGNGTQAGEYWRVTLTDGTQIILGANHLPGGNGGDPATNSTFTEPVYGADTGTPCHASTFASSVCTQAWRWNIAYRIDPHQNLVSYFYNTETNYYEANGSTLTSYVRGGYPTRIAYGISVPGAVAGRNAAAQVLFTSSERCTTSTTVCQYSNLNSTTASNWPDVPYDQNCTSSGSCSNISPSFWSTKRLTGITTQVLVGSAYQNVDSYALSQQFLDPGDGTGQDLWLNSITRTGTDNGSITLPAVSFTPVQMADRVAGLTSGGQGLPPNNRPRMSQITDEAGGTTSVTYNGAQCSSPSALPSSPSNDTMLCYAQYWTPSGQTGPILDWFNKYTVASVMTSDRTGLAPAQNSNYTYVGTPAWHSDDNELTQASQRTWDDFRGFAKVTTTKGTAPDPVTQTTVTYLRGMNGDINGSGQTVAATVTDSQGNVYTDDNALAGATLETQTYDHAGGAVITDTLTKPELTAATATHVRTSPLPAQYAKMHAVAATVTRKLLASGQWGVREVDQGYDTTTNANRLLTSDDKGDGTAAGELCTATTYATSTANPMMLDYPARELTLNAPCGTTPTAANTASDVRGFYDTAGKTVAQAEATFGTIGSVGDQTMTEGVDSFTGGTENYVATSQTGYDGYGRELSSTDPNAVDAAHPNGSTTTTAYSPATGATPTSVATTNPLGWVTTKTMDPLRDVATHTVDPNGRVTDITYDALGRTLAVWLPGRSKANQSANTVYTYTMPGGSSPVTVETQTLREDGSYGYDYKVLDGLLQARQEQSSAPDASAGRIVTDTFHDTHGWVSKTSAGYYNTGAPSSTVFLANDSQVPSQTVTTFDGTGRTVQSTFYSFAQPQWSTTTAYRGADRTDVTPPNGAPATTTLTDPWGRTVQSWTYHTATPTGNSADADVITTAYNAAGEKLSVTDATGKNTWRYSYDQRGRVIQSTDPDTGTSKVSYNGDGQTATTTDGRNQVLAYTYDLLGRMTGEYDTSTSGTELASWSYDQNAKGLVDSSTRYSGGNAYTSTITGYTTSYKPTGNTVTIPAAEGALAGSYTTGYTYTPNTELLDHVDLPAAGPLGAETVYYAYNLAGELLQSGGNHDYLTDQKYDSLGHPIRTTLGDMPLQAVVTSTYDQATGRRLTDTFNAENASNTLDTINYTYTASGLLTSATDAQLGGATDRQCYGYDHAGRLTAAWSDTGSVTTAAAPSVLAVGGCANAAPTAASAATQVGGPAPYWQTYGYDVAGNRTTDTQHDVNGITANDVTRNYSYPAAGTAGAHSLSCDTINAAPPASCPATADATHDVYTYDAAGNTRTRSLATGANQTLTYDQEGRLTGVTDATTGATSGYLYDASGALLIQRDPSDTVLYLNGQEVHLNPKTGATYANRYITTPGGATAVESSAGAITYELSNIQGTPVEEVNGANLSVTRRYYDPYGRVRGSAPTAWPDSHGYLNKPADATTGLDMLGARAYDPTTGRFLSRDSVFESADPSQIGGYSYAGDSPASFADPSGLTKCDIEPELCSARIQELAAEADAAQAAAEQAYEDSLESDQIDRCHSGMCEQKVAKNWQDPSYAQQQVTKSIDDAEAAGEAKARAAAARAQAAASSSASGQSDLCNSSGVMCAKGGSGKRAGKQSAPTLSAEEQQALDNEAAGLPADQAALKRAKRKLVTGEKYAGDRDKKKRSNNSRSNFVSDAQTAGEVVLGGTAVVVVVVAAPVEVPVAVIGGGLAAIGGWLFSS